MVAWHTNKAHLCASQHGQSTGGPGGFADEGVVNIHLSLTFAAERSTRAVRFIFSRGQRYYNDASCGEVGGASAVTLAWVQLTLIMT